MISQFKCYPFPKVSATVCYDIDSGTNHITGEERVLMLVRNVSIY